MQKRSGYESLVHRVDSFDRTLADSVKLILGTGSDAAIYYNGTDLIIDPQEVGSGNVKINAGSLDLNNQGGLLNVGAAGNDLTANQYILNNANAGASNQVRVGNTDNTNSISHARLLLETGGGSSGDPKVVFQVLAGELVSLGLDNTVSDNFTISDGDALGTSDRLRLVIATGVLSVDGDGGGADDPVSLFDKYDDAKELQRYAYTLPAPFITEEQRMSNRNRMVEMGVAEWAAQDDGSNHLMIRLQPMTKLLAGGIYQNRQRMDSQYDELNKRLTAVGA